MILLRHFEYREISSVSIDKRTYPICSSCYKVVRYVASLFVVTGLNVHVVIVTEWTLFAIDTWSLL